MRARQGGGQLVALTVLAYVALLAWDRERDRDPITGEFSGPYQPWQVVVLVVVLLALGVWAVSRPDPAVVFVVPAALTFCFSVDGYLDDIVRGSDGLWPVGAAMVAVGSSMVAGVLLLVSWLARQAAKGFSSRRRREVPGI